MKRTHDNDSPDPVLEIERYMGNRLRDAVSQACFVEKKGEKNVFKLSSKPLILQCTDTLTREHTFLAYWPRDQNIGDAIVIALDTITNSDEHLQLASALVATQSGLLTDDSKENGHEKARQSIMDCAGISSLKDLGHFRLIPPRDETWPLTLNKWPEEYLSPHLMVIVCWFTVNIASINK